MRDITEVNRRDTKIIAFRLSKDKYDTLFRQNELGETKSEFLRRIVDAFLRTENNRH